MSFISYPHLILLISGQTFKVTVACEKFWELNGALARELNYRKQADWNAIVVYNTTSPLCWVPPRIRSQLVMFKVEAGPLVVGSL